MTVSKSADMIYAKACSLLPLNCMPAAGRLEHPVVKQFPALKLRGLPEFQGSYTEDTLWGTYRSGQYLGMLDCCTCAACSRWEWAYLCIRAPDRLPQPPALSQSFSFNGLLSLSCHHWVSGSLAEAETASRCHHFAGLRMRVPSSLLVGLMWFDPDLPNAPAALRHNAEDRDGEYMGEERVTPDCCLQAGLHANRHCSCFSRCAQLCAAA